MSVLADRHQFSVDDYHRMVEAGILTENDRVELVRGEIIRMSPIGPRHASSVDLLAEWFILRLEKQARVRVQNPSTIESHSEPQPDLVIVRPGDYRRRHPGPEDTLLVVEVADSSLTYDRRTKMPLYAAAGIPEGWLVNLCENVVEVYREPGPTGYTSVRRAVRGEKVSPLAFPDLVLSVDEVLGL
jgi:Uma2 family endonuclease